MSKDKRTLWIQKVNDIRKIVAHSSSGRTVSVDQLTELTEYDEWLHNSIKQLYEGEKEAGEGEAYEEESLEEAEA